MAAIRPRAHTPAPLLAALLAVCLLALAAAPGSAGAVIVPERSIDGIGLQWTRAIVVEARGGPDAERIVRTPIVGRQRMLRYGRTRVYFGGTGRRAHALAIATRDRRQRTRAGVGIGSTPAQIRRGLPRSRCQRGHGFHTCSRGGYLPGSRVTSFKISRRGTAYEVVVGIVID